MSTRMTGSLVLALLLTLSVSVAQAGSLVGYWSFDNVQGTLVPDQSGSGNDGTIQGTPAVIDGPFGKGLQLNGTSDYVDVGNAPSLNLTTKVTLAAWVKTQDAGTPAAGTQVGQNHYISKHNSYQIKHRTNLLIFAIWDAAAPFATRISIDNSFNGEWHHVVGTYDGKALKTYVDGKMEGEAAHVGDIDSINLNVNIGKNPNQNDMNFRGGIDEVQIYNRDLSAAQVQEVFAGTLPSFARAVEPDPVDGAKGVALPMVKWTPGEGAVLHEVYFGTDPNLTPTDFRGSQAIAMYWHQPGLTPGQTYYWRIDEVAADGTRTTGKVWSFTAASLKAYGPKPRDGMLWLDPAGVKLAWEYGQGAIQHDIYFGTDKAAVEAGAASVLVGKQSVNSYNPGPLQSDTTYYWRIDEHTSTGELNQGSVWTFSTSGGRYDGVKAEYFANPDVTGQPAVVRTEPKIDFTWPDGTTEGVNSPAVGIPVNNYSARWSAELRVAFSGEYRFVVNIRDSGRLWLDDKLLIDRWPNDGSIPEYSTKAIQLVAGNTYALVMEWNKYNPGASARLEWIDPFGERSIVGPGYLQLPLRANKPRPTMGQKDVTDTPVLQWSPGSKAAQHDVYFGVDAQAVAAADTASSVYQGRQALAETTFDPGPLPWGQTYYWRVDEVNSASPDSPWKGDVWSFTVADFLVVDDFEGYTDNEGSRIYETWIDGWTNATGSVVGYLQAPFAEQRIVRNGRQSLPLEYNNVKTPYYSEAERTWDTSQNWTVHGVDTLTLCVQGQTANTAQAFYVTVEDAAGHAATAVHPDAAVLTKAQWTEWRVPLSSLTGVNAARIKKIVLGVGNRTSPAAGSRGRIYIDDIRIMKGGN